jgi:hypothetical protein
MVCQRCDAGSTPLDIKEGATKEEGVRILRIITMTGIRSWIGANAEQSESEYQWYTCWGVTFLFFIRMPGPDL